MAIPYHGMIEEVCVMLVDNDKEYAAEMTDLLNSHYYKVMMVDTTSTAMSTLSKGKQKIDVMILNISSLNLLSFDLLTQAVALDIISLVVCDEFNELIAKNALDNGAYLYLQKPLEKEIVKYLWQFVLSGKIRSERARERSEENRDQMKADDIGNNNVVGQNKESEEKKNVPNAEEQSNNIHEAENDVVLNGRHKLKRKRGRPSMREINDGESQNNTINKVVKRKDYIEWTDELHAKFMEAIQLLGEGRCYPMKILEVMNLPGLTRMQVASHLQKCRRNNWRSPGERKFIRQRSAQRSSSVSHETRSGFRKFGTMPCIQASVPNQQRNPNQIQRGPELSFPILNSNNIFGRGESSIQRQFYRQQRQVQPRYLSIDNPFLSTQANVGGGLTQQHGPLLKMLGSQGLQNPVIENTYYRPGLTLNNGDHTEKNGRFDLNVAPRATYSSSRTVNGTYIGNTTINDYNLNANVDNVTTYSRGTIMSDTYVGNVTINGLGARNANANANFQQYIGEPKLSGPRNIVLASYEDDVEESNSNEMRNCDAYFNFNNMGYVFQNLEPPGANLPNEQGSEFDQIYSDDQVAGASSTQFTGLENHSEESSI